NGSIYNHHDEEMSVDDIGFFGEALKIHTYIATGNVSRLLFVMPKTYIDFCNAGMEPWQHDQWGGLYGTNGGGGGGGGRTWNCSCDVRYNGIYHCSSVARLFGDVYSQCSITCGYPYLAYCECESIGCITNCECFP
ncbi:MAG: hypothetical protein QXP53_03040, partial [Candidatus Pacearchaeota archaeon]